MAEIKSLVSLVKTGANANDVLLVTNTSTGSAKKYALTNLFPSLNTSGTSSQPLFVGVTNKNQLNFKGIKSSTSSMLSVGTASNNIEVAVLPAGIDLSLCDNSTAQFSTGVNFNGVVSGIAPVSNGGTGLGVIATGAVLMGTATNVIGTSTMSANGQLLIGNATTGYPSVATLTAGANVTITNAAGAITVAASLGALSAHLDTGSYNIDLNTNYISPNGTDNKGIYVHSSGKVILNESGTTLGTADSQLHLMGSSSNAISIGNGTNSYQSSYTVKCDDAAASGTGGAGLLLKSGSATAGNANGGGMTVRPGDASGTGTGGDLLLYSGAVASGTSGVGGAIKFYATTANGSGSVESARVLNDGQFFLYENTTVAKTLRLTASSVPTIVKYQGTPTNSTTTTALVAAAVLTGIVTCDPDSDHSKATDTASNYVNGLSLTADGDSFDFVFINLGADSENRDITVTAGTGITLVGNMHISSPDTADASIASGSAQFRIRRTSATAVTMYRIA
tara:strand:- start:2253 stop:3776 length:1524 start_codon:yes stop_codon:yes gene_type:complete